MKNCRRSRGFTLIELLIVFTIMASIVGLVSWSVYAVMLEHRLKAAFDDLALEIKTAQAEAVLAQKELLLRYDLVGNQLRVELPGELDVDEYLTSDRESRRKQYESEPGELIREYQIDSSIKLESVYVDGDVIGDGVASVFFGPDGTAEAHRVLLSIKESGVSVALELRGLIGEIREVDPQLFEVDFTDQDKDQIPMTIEDEDFFDEGYPEKEPRPSEGSEG